MTRRVLETVTRVAGPHTDCRTSVQMTAICCEDAAAVPCCEQVESWTGYNDDEFAENLGLNLDAQGRDSEGRYVEIRRLPRSKPCGEKMTRYDVTPNSCCEGVAQIVVDVDESAEVIADHSSGLVIFSGGVPPFHISVRGNGFHLNPDNYIRDGYIDGRVFRVYAEDACGPAFITITDGCSTAEHILRSPNGQWVDASPQPESCPFTFVMSHWTWEAGYGAFSLTYGNYRILNYTNVYGGSTYCETEDPLYPNCDGAVPTTVENKNLCIDDFDRYAVTNRYPGFTGSVSHDLTTIYFDGADCSPECSSGYPICCGFYSYIATKTVQEWVC